MALPDLTVRIGGDTSELTSALDDGVKGLTSFGAAGDSATSAMSQSLEALAAAAGDTGDDLSDLGKTVGETGDALTGAGTDADALTSSLSDLSDETENVATGMGAIQTAVQAAGDSFSGLSDSAESAFSEIEDKAESFAGELGKKVGEGLVGAIAAAVGEAIGAAIISQLEEQGVLAAVSTWASGAIASVKGYLGVGAGTAAGAATATTAATTTAAEAEAVTSYEAMATAIEASSAEAGASAEGLAATIADSSAAITASTAAAAEAVQLSATAEAAASTAASAEVVAGTEAVEEAAVEAEGGISGLWAVAAGGAGVVGGAVVGVGAAIAALGAVALAVVAIGTAAIGAGVAMAALAVSTNDEVNAWALTAAQTGTSFQNVATFQGAGSDIGSLFGGGNLQDELQQLNQIAQGIGTISDAIRSAIQDTAGQGGVATIVAAFQNLADPVDKAALAVQLFGTNAAKALDLMNQSTVQAVKNAGAVADTLDQATRDSLARIADDLSTLNPWKDFVASFGSWKPLLIEAITSAEIAFHDGLQGIKNDAQSWIDQTNAYLSSHPLSIPLSILPGNVQQAIQGWLDNLQLPNVMPSSPGGAPGMSEQTFLTDMEQVIKTGSIGGSNTSFATQIPGYTAPTPPTPLTQAQIDAFNAAMDRFQFLLSSGANPVGPQEPIGGGTGQQPGFVSGAPNTFAPGTMITPEEADAVQTLKENLDAAYQSTQKLYDATGQLTEGYISVTGVANQFQNTIIGTNQIMQGEGLKSTVDLATAAGTLALNYAQITSNVEAGTATIADQSAAYDAWALAALKVNSAVTDLTGQEQVLQATIKDENAQGLSATADQASQLAAIKLALSGQSDLWNEINKAASGVFSTISSGLTKALFDWQNFGKDISNLLDQIGQKIVTSLIDNLLLTKTNLDAITTAFTSLLQGNSLSSVGSNLLNSLHIGNPGAVGTPTAAQLAGAQGVGGYMGSGTFAGPLPPTDAENLANSGIPQETIDSMQAGGTFSGTEVNAGDAGLQGAVQNLTGAVQAQTGAVGAAMQATFQSTAANVQLGNVVQGSFAPIPSALAQNTQGLQGVSETFQPLGADVQNLGETITPLTSATQAATTATGAQTNAAQGLTNAVQPNTDAMTTNTDATQTNSSDLGNLDQALGGLGGGGGGLPGGGSGGSSGAGGLSGLVGPDGEAVTGAGGALGGIESALGGLGTSVAGVVGLGVQVASMAVQGDELAQLNNKMWVLVSSNQGILNQLIDLQNSANDYWPQLVHLTDIWGAIVQNTGTVGVLYTLLLNMAQAGMNAINDIAPGGQNLNGSEMTVSSTANGGSDNGMIVNTNNPVATTAVTNAMAQNSKTSSDNTVALGQQTQATSSLKGGIDGLISPITGTRQTLEQLQRALRLPAPTLGQTAELGISAAGSLNAPSFAQLNNQIQSSLNILNNQPALSPVGNAPLSALGAASSDSNIPSWAQGLSPGSQAGAVSDAQAQATLAANEQALGARELASEMAARTAQEQAAAQADAQYQAAQTAAYNAQMAGYQANTDAVLRASQIYEQTGTVVSAAAIKAGDSIQTFSADASQWGQQFATDMSLAEAYKQNGQTGLANSYNDAAASIAAAGANAGAHPLIDPGTVWASAADFFAGKGTATAGVEGVYGENDANPGSPTYGLPGTPAFGSTPINSNSEPISWNTSDFTGMTGLASLSQSVTSSSSPSLTTSSPNAQKVQVTVIAANPGSRATGQALVSSIRNLGVKI